MKKSMMISSLVARKRQRISRIRLLRRREGRSLPLILAVAIIAFTTPTGYSFGADQPGAASTEPGPAPGAATQKELEELVSPIALYPDLLVARILAASTYPNQVVEAHEWLQQNKNLSHEQLAAQVNAQSWDPSIKSLAQFSPVLQTMSDSLAWTSALGEAYFNQPDDVMEAIQALRSRAIEAGTLKTTAQQKVEVQPAAPPASSAGEATARRTAANSSHSASPTKRRVCAPIRPRDSLRSSRARTRRIYRDRDVDDWVVVLRSRDGAGGTYQRRRR